MPEKNFVDHILRIRGIAAVLMEGPTIEAKIIVSKVDDFIPVLFID